MAPMKSGQKLGTHPRPRLPHRRLLRQVLVPGTGEAATAYKIAREEVFLPGPFASGQLVGYLYAVAVGVVNVDADGYTVVAHPVDVDVFSWRRW